MILNSLFLEVGNYWGIFIQNINARRFIHNIPEMISLEVEKQKRGEFQIFLERYYLRGEF